MYYGLKLGILSFSHGMHFYRHKFPTEYRNKGVVGGGHYKPEAT